jgi:putative sterol carrier protein
MPEPVFFATDAWVERLRNEINGSESYRSAARNWEGDFFFIVQPDNNEADPVYMYLDLYHGQCRQAFVPDNPADLQPEYQVRGTLRVWRAITRQELDPIKALVTRQLTLKGNMAKVLRNVKAANELVNCATKFETEFPL